MILHLSPSCLQKSQGPFPHTLLTGCGVLHLPVGVTTLADPGDDKKQMYSSYSVGTVSAQVPEGGTER